MRQEIVERLASIASLAFGNHDDAISARLAAQNEADD